MRIGVGSTNPVKVQAVRELALVYDLLRDADIISFDVASQVSDQPKSIGETVQGAKNRAKAAFEGCDLGFGLESGFIEVPGTQTDMLDCGVCAIYNGKCYAIGISPAFECPPRVMGLVRKKGYDLNQAFFEAGLTTNPRIGSDEGAVGLLTKGRVTRLHYTKLSIMMAMIQLEHPQHY